MSSLDPMAEWDSSTGKVRPTWQVRFRPWWVFVGSAIAGVVTAAMVFVTFVAGGGEERLNEQGAVIQGGVLLLGLTVGVFVLLGPALAWGLGFVLRNNPNHSVHVMAFGVLGLVVGFMLGELLAPGLGSVTAPAAGIGAAVGRWAVSRQATIV